MSKVIYDKEMGCIVTERDDYTFVEHFILVVEKVGKEEVSAKMQIKPAFELLMSG